MKEIGQKPSKKCKKQVKIDQKYEKKSLKIDEIWVKIDNATNKYRKLIKNREKMLKNK